MSDLPQSVVIHEEGPREGFQNEKCFVPTDAKLRLIHALAETGLREIQCTSFVNPARVPQMADAQELAARLIRRLGVRYTALWLNQQGFQRARSSGLDLRTSIATSASNSFCINNNGCSAEEMIRRQRVMMESYREHEMQLEAAYVFTAFGCHYEGRISPGEALQAAAELLTISFELGMRPELVYFCDTVGVANPAQVEAVIGAARSRWPNQKFALHLHDTYGMGLANALAGLKLGIAHFDTSCAGMGGCPFSGEKNAPGNICTEDFVFMCEEMGVSTGVDLKALCDCAELSESIVGRTLPGRLIRSGYRSRRPDSH